MLTLCWSPKGGSGVSVTAAALALSLAEAGRDTLLVDLDGDQPFVLGLGVAPGPGLHDWLLSPAEVPVDALGALEVRVGERLNLLPRGRPIGGPLRTGRGATSAEAERLRLVADVLTTSSREIVIDGGPAAGEPIVVPGRQVIVVRSCYLALRRLREASILAPRVPTIVVLVQESGRVLRADDVAGVLGSAGPALLTTAWDPAVARCVDAGLLTSRRPRSLARLARAVNGHDTSESSR